MNEKFFLLTELIKLSENANTDNGCAVAVGSFDGVHLGHRAMIKVLVEEAKKLGVPAAVFTFHTDDNPKVSSKLLAQREKKLRLLKELGVDIVASAPFSALRDVSASDFALEFVFEGMGAKSIVCGYDFRFGKNRGGDAELIKVLLSPKGVKVITPPVLVSEREPVSSTFIRKLISSGEVKKANELLGDMFSFEALVVHGAMLGRKLGFPTINQPYPDELTLLRFGVYAVHCVLGGKTYFGVANVGVKPTVSSDSAPLCETHIFDFSEDCYGKNIEIRFVEFIREEKRFSSVDELKAQIERDRKVALEICSKGV